MVKIIKIIWNTITSILVAIALVFALLLVVPKVAGFDMYVVLSGSMEPAYPTGSMIYVNDVKTDELEVGDVITYQLNSNTISTHRIVEVVNENNQIAFKTKGDANEHEDSNLVQANAIIGTPKFSVPYLGYITSYIQKPPGLYVALSLAVSLILLISLSDLLFDEEEKEKKVETDKISRNKKGGKRE